MYQTEEALMNKIYPISNSGIYINPNQLQNAVSNWVENTSDDIKIKQIKQFAMIGFILCGAILILSK